MVPVALAYAGLAGVPPEVGLTTAFASLAAYAIFGTSRHLKVTASSTMAIMSAAVVVDLAEGDPAKYLVLTSALALIVGVMLVAAGVARLGFVADFLTKSVVTGFIFGLAITIVIGQIPKLLGVPAGGGSVPDQLRTIVAELPDTNPYTLAVGLTSLVVILVLRAISPRIPGPLIALVIGLVAVPLLGLQAHGVSVVGEVATGLPSLSIPWCRCPRSRSSPWARRASCSSPWASRSAQGGRSARVTTTRSTPTRSCSRWAPPTSRAACSGGSRPTRASRRPPPPRRPARSRSSARSSRRR